jgi:hypothetical protein
MAFRATPSKVVVAPGAPVVTFTLGKAAMSARARTARRERIGDSSYHSRPWQARKDRSAGDEFPRHNGHENDRSDQIGPASSLLKFLVIYH